MFKAGNYDKQVLSVDSSALNLYGKFQFEYSRIENEILHLSNPDRQIPLPSGATAVRYLGHSHWLLELDVGGVGAIASPSGVQLGTAVATPTGFTGTLPVGFGLSLPTLSLVENFNNQSNAANAHGNPTNRLEYTNPADNSSGSPTPKDTVIVGEDRDRTESQSPEIDFVGDSFSLYRQIHAQDFDATQITGGSALVESSFPIDLYCWPSNNTSIAGTHQGSIGNQIIVRQVWNQSTVRAIDYLPGIPQPFIGNTPFAHPQDLKITLSVAPSGLGPWTINQNMGSYALKYLESLSTTNQVNRPLPTFTYQAPPTGKTYNELLSLGFNKIDGCINENPGCVNLLSSTCTHDGIYSRVAIAPNNSSSSNTVGVRVGNPLFLSLVGRACCVVVRVALSEFRRSFGIITAYNTSQGQVIANEATTSSTRVINGNLTSLTLDLSREETIAWDYNARNLALGQTMIYTTDGYANLPKDPAHCNGLTVNGVPMIYCLNSNYGQGDQSTQVELWQIPADKPELVRTFNVRFYPVLGQVTGPTTPLNALYHP